MSKDVRSARYKPLSQAKINDILKNNPNNPITVEHEHIEPKPVLSGCGDYDTLHPEQTFKDFCAAVREMISRYESDKDRLVELENEMQDILHYIELSGDKDIQAGFKLYKKLAIVRRERRDCKNEMDLLQPVYDAFHETSLLTKLTDVLGKVRSNQQFVETRCYSVRTDILGDITRKEETI